MKFDVISLSLNQDGSVFYKKGKPLVRIERIDTETNEIFKDSISEFIVKHQYEAFWRLDREWKKGQCKVLEVVEVKSKNLPKTEDDEK